MSENRTRCQNFFESKVKVNRVFFMYFDKWNKIAFSSLSDINTTFKIGITVIWSFTLHYVIAIISLWCWKKILHNYVTSISIRNQSTSRWKPNKKLMSAQYWMPTGIICNYFWVIHLINEEIIIGNNRCAVINIFVYFIWLKLFTKNFCIKFSYFKINEKKDLWNPLCFSKLW